MDHLSGLVFRRPQATLTADLWSIFAPPFSPDKVAHLGEEFQEIAKARTKAINQAYETLKAL